MNKLKPGDSAPSFCLFDSDKNRVCLSDLKGKWVVLYFYPKDNTSGCTLEAIDFTKEMNWFSEQNAIILGISPDSPESHCNFRDKHDLKVTLLSDPEHKVLESYGVWVLKKMYGREYFGVERSTFLIDLNGKIAHIWRKVKVPNHISEVKEKLISLTG